LNDCCPDSASASKQLLARDDPPPAVVANPGGASPFLLLGDHAGRAIPRSLVGLGLPAGALDLHIALDIGVAGLGEALSKRLDATWVRQSYSRLVIDCNRTPGAGDSIPTVSDGVTIPGNLGLGPRERSWRRAEVFDPYHAVVAQALDARAGRGQRTFLVSLHSFTPSLQGVERQVRFGVLHRGDSALSRRMLALLRDAEGDAAGDNQPYAMDGTDYTIPHHVDPRSVDYLELEVRQDLLSAPSGANRVAAFLAGLLLRVASE
jgi:predicted N-formylglutamate amidohydrolase